MNQRKTPDQWRSILADYERSNQTQVEFCRRRRIALTSFQYHRHRQRHDGAGAQRLIEIRPAATTPPRPPCGAVALSARADEPELRIDVPLSSARAVTLHCTLAQLPEVIAQLALSSLPAGR